MKEIPILYSTPMIQAKLAGRKTQTRRIVKFPYDNNAHDSFEIWGSSSGETGMATQGADLLACFRNKILNESFHIRCPYGKPGDLLWAREAWSYSYHWEAYQAAGPLAGPYDYENYPVYCYRANIPDTKGWKPSIHMPKGAARIWDRVVSIRVERLQDISEEDAIAEGIYPCTDPLGGYTYKDSFGWVTAKEAYQALWESINGEGSWELNPWVWRVETENVSLTGKP